MTTKTTNLEGQTSLEAGKPHILLIFMCYSPYIFGDPEFQSLFRLNFSCTFIKMLAMKSVGSDSQNDPFSRSNELRSGKPTILPIYVCYSLLIFGDSEF